MTKSYVTHVCPSCGEAFEAAPRAITCSGRCRQRRHTALLAGRTARRERAFELLLAHGAEIRAALDEGRPPRREVLDVLAQQMDALHV